MACWLACGLAGLLGAGTGAGAASGAGASARCGRQHGSLCFGEGFIYCVSSLQQANDANKTAAGSGWCGRRPKANRADAGESVSFDGSGQDLREREGEV
ncbi:hypothetical protein N431DRAFT_438021 [Stipitochalara longipes BDJ]|nr:hypothetical protein N431DRAFT_438021 [Stipitochalara longipes BDJ]